MIETPTLFISYSHQDEKPWKDFVVDHLEVAERQGVFDVWEDRRIKGGGDWLAEINKALASADIAVLLISRHFLTSDFIMDHEVQTILRRCTSDGMKLYPILISDCTWQSVDWLQAINIRPTDGTPLNSFSEAERDQVMTGLASEIVQLLHPNQENQGTSTSPSSGKTTFDQTQPSGKGGKLSLGWWRSTSSATRVTVLGTIFVGLALVWSIVTAILPSENDCTINAQQGIAACDDVEIGGDVNLGQGQ